MFDKDRNKANLKINPEALDWVLERQAELKKAEGKKPTQWELFDRMRRAFDLKTSGHNSEYPEKYREMIEGMMELMEHANNPDREHARDYARALFTTLSEERHARQRRELREHPLRKTRL